MKTVFLFPGQGSQKPGMLHAFAGTDPIVARIFQQTAATLGVAAETLDSAEKLESTQYVQLCLLITEVISAQRLMAEGVNPDFVAGHSIGAFSAAVIAGVLSFEQALLLVDLRGRLMQEAYPKGYGMAAMVGFTETRLKRYIDEHNKNNSQLYLANLNAVDQQVVAGETASLEILIQTLQKAGINRAKLLNMSVPSHCLLLDGVAAALQTAIEAMPLQEPAVPYLSNHTGRLLSNAAAVKTDLYLSVARSVKWYDGTTLLYELGARCFIELEPSGVLSKIAEAAFPDALVLASEENGTAKVAWLWKEEHKTKE